MSPIKTVTLAMALLLATVSAGEAQAGVMRLRRWA